MRRAPLLFVFLASVAGAGCGRVVDEESGEADAAEDAEGDEAIDAVADARVDTAIDVAPEVSFDAVADVVGDARDASPPPDASVDFAPVCGSDGITYWNADQAAAAGVSAASGRCSGRVGGAGACGAFFGTPCPSGTVCIGEYIAFTATYCTMSGDWDGHCWRIPAGATCPSVGEPELDCATSTCSTYCEVVRSVHPFRPDKGC